MPLSCEEVRALLPEQAEGRPRPAGQVEEHLASCAACRAELASYRELLGALAAFREVDEVPSPQFLTETIRVVRISHWSGLIPALPDVRQMAGRLVALVRERRPVALASLGGAAVGATAIALVWWRMARRAVGHAAGVPL